VRQALPHTYVEHAEEHAAAPILSKDGKPLMAPKMVDGFEVATLRQHAVEESEDNMFEEPVVFLTLGEGEEIESDPSSDPVLINEPGAKNPKVSPDQLMDSLFKKVKIIDPKQKRLHRYTNRRCKGKKCTSWMVPRYRKVKGEKPKKPVQYMAPEFAVPKVQTGVVIHLRGKKKRINPMKGLSMKHVMTPNEEFLRKQALFGLQTITPDYTDKPRKLKQFHNPEMKDWLKAQKLKLALRRKNSMRKLGSTETYALHRMHNARVVVPEYKARRKHKRHNHVGVWHPAKLIPGTKAAVFLQESEEVAESDEAESEDESEEEESEEESDESEDESESEEESEEEESDEEEADEESEEESEESEEDAADESEAAAIEEAASQFEESEAEEETGADAMRFAEVEEPKSKKNKKAKKHTIEAAYFPPPPNKQPQYTSPEYNDPNPKLTAAKAKKAAKSGKPQHPTVFKTSFFSPLPKPNKHVKCVGKKHHKKCYRVDQKSGMLIGFPGDKKHPFALQFGVTGRSAVETPTVHMMEQKGFQDPEYNDAIMAKWKPKKNEAHARPRSGHVLRRNAL